MASDDNVAYSNIRCRNVASEIRDRLNIDANYVVGDILICQKMDTSGS